MSRIKSIIPEIVNEFDEIDLEDTVLPSVTKL